MGSEFQIKYKKGILCLEGPAIDLLASKYLSLIPKYALQNRMNRDGEQFHLTLTTPQETKGLIQEEANEYFRVNDFVLCDIGLSIIIENQCEAWYLSIFSPQIQFFRRSQGLQEKDLHITLGFSPKDPHGLETSFIFNHIKEWNSWQNISKNILQLFENPLHQFLNNDFILSYPMLCKQETLLIERIVYNIIDNKLSSHDEIRTMKTIAMYLIKKKNTKVIEDIAWYFLSNGLPFGLKILLATSYFQLGFVDLTSIEKHLPFTLASSLLTKTQLVDQIIQEMNSYLLKHSFAGVNRVLCVEENKVITKALPRNFSWINLPNQESNTFLLSGSAYPSEPTQLLALQSAGIRHIITIHENAFPHDFLLLWKNQFQLNYHFFQVPDREPPILQTTCEMVSIITRAINNKEGVLIHCQGGVGRTNTVIIAYLMSLCPGEAASRFIDEVKLQRKLILSTSQQEFLRTRWFRHVNIGGFDPLVFKSPKPTTFKIEDYVKSYKGFNFPPIIMLCGPACSGKSTFSKTLIESVPQHFFRINRDEMREYKNQCEDVFMEALKRQKKYPLSSIILDGCHLTAEKRKEWLEMSHNARTWCIFFNRSIAHCKERIVLRENHPTIPPGIGGLKILDSMSKQLQPPSQAEGFERIIYIESDEDMVDQLTLWKIPFIPPSTENQEQEEKEVSDDKISFEVNKNIDLDKPIKFPRTSHAINLGSATRDDKILPLQDLTRWIEHRLPVIIEEKIDGANVGFWINEQEGRIVAQNRSHFINSQYHPQFSLLDKWIHNHSIDLWNILIPNRTILYGEWVYATHSVSYNRLPAYFVAYDLFDIQTETFLSRSELKKLLQSTKIPIVPCIYEGELKDKDHLLSLVHGPSQYGDEPREGIVIRVIQDQQVLHRAKIVRSDFIAGNERWNRSSVLKTNSLDSNLLYK